MRYLPVLPLVALAGCSHGDWRANAIADAEALVRRQVDDPSLKFTRVQFTGDRASGQTCGHYEKPDPGAGIDDTRFIVFIDGGGGGGQNPYIDDASMPYPTNKTDFALNWRTQCVGLGYRE